MKRSILCLLIFSVLCGCARDNKETFTSIDANAVVEKIVNKETFVLLLTSDACDPCDDFEDLIEPMIASDHLMIYRLNYSEVDSEMSDQLQLMLRPFSSWPTLMYIQDGVISDERIYEYSKDPEGWETWLVKQGLIAK